MSVSKKQLEDDWLNLLTLLEPTADALVNVIPQVAKTKWKQRQQAVSEQNRVLSARLEDQRALNRNLIESKLRGGKPCYQRLKRHTSSRQILNVS